MLTLKNLSVKIGSKKILTDINHEFKAGKLYAVMGPNGSGKSTLASTIAGHPVYEVQRGSKIAFEGKNIVGLDPDKRAKNGIFLSFQSPLSLAGVTVYQLMRYALNGKMDALKIRQDVQKYARELHISEDLLSRSLNEDFSGGEKKKMEVLQAAMLDPKLLILDEVDTGVDVDALRAISLFLKKMQSKDRTIILITHYNRILKYLKPDQVLVLIGGKLVKTGSATLAEEIEKNGYDQIANGE